MNMDSKNRENWVMIEPEVSSTGFLIAREGGKEQRDIVLERLQSVDDVVQAIRDAKISPDSTFVLNQLTISNPSAWLEAIEKLTQAQVPTDHIILYSNDTDIPMDSSLNETGIHIVRHLPNGELRDVSDMMAKRSKNRD